jgi:hypothetical protein
MPLDSDTGLVCQETNEREVFGREAFSLFVDRLDDADGFVTGVFHGGGEDALGEEAGAFVVGGIEARVFVRFGNVKDLAGCERGADDAGGAGDADVTGAQSDLGPKLLGRRIMNPDAGALAVKKAAGCFGDFAKQRIEIGRDGEHARHAEKELHLRSRDGRGMTIGAGGWKSLSHQLLLE